MIRLVQNSDTSDGRNLMPEPSQNADPAVTAEQSENQQAADTIDSASASDSKTSKELADPVDRYVTVSILHRQTTRPAGTERRTGHRRARMSLFWTYFPEQMNSLKWRMNHSA